MSYVTAMCLLSLFATTIRADADSSRKSDEAEDFPLTCEIRSFNFTAIQTDRSGKQCRGKVSTYGCYGSCDTFEVYIYIYITRISVAL